MSTASVPTLFAVVAPDVESIRVVPLADVGREEPHFIGTVDDCGREAAWLAAVHLEHGESGGTFTSPAGLALHIEAA